MAQKTQEQVKWPAARPLTKGRIDEHRKRLGMQINTRGENRGPNQVAHWDNVSVFVENVGDPNPLWSDEAHARKSPFGKVVAPPGFLLSVWPGSVAQGLPGVLSMVGGGSYEFNRPVLDGDKVTAECLFADLEEKSSAFSPLWLVEHYDNTYRNQRGELVGKSRTQMLRWDRGDLDAGLRKIDAAKSETWPHAWTDEQIKEIEDEVMAELEHIRGTTPRYWEDVKVGEALPRLTRGPRRLFDAVAECVATSVWRSGAVGLLELRRHPALSLYHPETRSHEHVAILEFDRMAAQAAGFPHSPDHGVVRQYYGMQAVTDWMGDDGWLKRFSARLRRPVYVSDVIRISSQVAKTYVDQDGEPCVDIEQHAVNQRGDEVMSSQATVALPSRERQTRPLTGRLPLAQ